MKEDNLSNKTIKSEEVAEVKDFKSQNDLIRDLQAKVEAQSEIIEKLVVYKECTEEYLVEIFCKPDEKFLTKLEDFVKKLLSELPKKAKDIYIGNTKQCFMRVAAEFNILMKASAGQSLLFLHTPIAVYIMEFLESEEIKQIINDKPENKYKLAKIIRSNMPSDFLKKAASCISWHRPDEVINTYKDKFKILKEFLDEACTEKHMSYRERIKKNISTVPSAVLEYLNFEDSRDWAKNIKAQQKSSQFSRTQNS